MALELVVEPDQAIGRGRVDEDDAVVERREGLEEPPHVAFAASVQHGKLRRGGVDRRRFAGAPAKGEEDVEEPAEVVGQRGRVYRLAVVLLLGGRVRTATVRPTRRRGVGIIGHL